MAKITSQTEPSISVATTSTVASSSMFGQFISPMSSSGILSGSSLMSIERLYPLFTSLVQYQADPISYSPWWPVIPQKLPSEIPKFNENPGEDPSTHVITYHLWCS